MKDIRFFEEAIAKEIRDIEAIGINPAMFWAYRTSKEVGNDLIDFHEIIWDSDIPGIAESCKKNDIREFTISCTFSSLIKVLAKFEQLGFKVGGLATAKANYTDFITGEFAVVPAIRMVLADEHQ